MVLGILAMVHGFHGGQPLEARRYEGQVSYRREYQYYLYLPEDYAKTTKRYPVVLFLHGRGVSGDDLARVKEEGIAKEIARGRKFPFVVVAPLCPWPEFWDPYGLAAMLESVVKKYRIDAKRQYITGLSMGGFGAYDMAAIYPNRYAAIAPVSGGKLLKFAKALAATPILAVHGDADELVSYQEDLDLIQAVRKEGGVAEMETIKGGHHDAWIQTYAGNKIYDWLLAHHR
jgi:predicted peptidase